MKVIVLPKVVVVVRVIPAAAPEAAERQAAIAVEPSAAEVSQAVGASEA
jgi:hypothetical protein